MFSDVKFSAASLVLAVVVGAVLAALTVYLTPLKHLAILEPSIVDQGAREFQSEFGANKDNYLFIDVRPADAYARTHASGSINMPLHTLYNTRRSLPKTEKEIVFICTEGVASGVAYHYLQHFGFFNIRRIEGGVEKWIADGLPIEGTALSGETPARQ